MNNKNMLTIEEVLPNRTPGRLLRGLRYREDLTQEAFGRRLGLNKSTISAMERDKRPISVKTAKRIAAEFSLESYQMFL